MTILPKAIYKFIAIPVKIPMALIAEIEKFFLKFIWNLKGPQRGKTNLKKKNKVGVLTLPDFKTCYKGTENSVVLA